LYKEIRETSNINEISRRIPFKKLKNFKWKYS
jgi:hypothetical protein